MEIYNDFLFKVFFTIPSAQLIVNYVNFIDMFYLNSKYRQNICFNKILKSLEACKDLLKIF